MDTALPSQLGSDLGTIETKQFEGETFDEAALPLLE